MFKSKSAYLGNTKLKSVGEQIEYTPDQVREYQKCMNDPIYFIRNYVHIVNLDEGMIKFNLRDYQEDMITKFVNNRFVICKCSRQVGKALDLNTPILTEDGSYKKMEDIHVGDMVMGPDGTPTRVVWESPVWTDTDCYEVEFDNGEIIRCSGDHLWTVTSSTWKTRKLDRQTKTLNTRELSQQLEIAQSRKQSVYIPVNDPIEYAYQDLPIDPYLLGLWLGDGSSNTGTITCHEEDYNHYSELIQEDVGQLRKYNKPNSGVFTVPNLSTAIRVNNLKRNKHIPQEYLVSDIDQRVSLLKGLMDSDGSCTPKGSCEFYNKNEELIDQTRVLLSSLGIKSRKRSKVIDGTMYYTLRFCSPDFEVFSLPRKLQRMEMLHGHPQNQRHYIQSIRPIESIPTKCIEVDRDDHLFLCGHTNIPTHNSITTVAYFLWYILFQNHKSVAILANKGSLAGEQLDRLKKAYELLPKWLQQGVVEWNKRSIELENGSTVIAAATTASSIRGESFNCIMLDEFAHIHENQAEEFLNSVYPTISSGKSTQVIIVSTPKGMNMFYKIWNDAENGRNDYVTVDVNWRMVPGRDEKWKQETIRNTNERLFSQEQDCVVGNTIITVLDTETGEVFDMPIGDLEYL